MLPSDSCQAAIQSDTQRDTAGRRKEAARRSRQSEEEKDNGAAATLNRPVVTDRRREDREHIQDVTELKTKTRSRRKIISTTPQPS